MRIDGRLQADGPDGSIVIDGRGTTVVATVVGRPDFPARERIAQMARAADSRGLRVEVVDNDGRPLADFGRDASSILARLLFRSQPVQPHRRGIARWLIRRRGR